MLSLKFKDKKAQISRCVKADSFDYAMFLAGAEAADLSALFDILLFISNLHLIPDKRCWICR